MLSKERDLQHLKYCLKLARQAAGLGEVPVGALIANSETGEIVATAYNLKENLKSPLGHAEVVVIHRACKKLGVWRLTGYTLYSSLEPCVMCSGVILQSRLDRVVWSAEDPKGGGESLFGILTSEKTNHILQTEQGGLADQSGELLKSFFKERRKSKK